MRPRGPSSSSPSSWYVGQVAVQKPQCTHLRRMASASRPSGVSRMKSASSVCTAGYTFGMKTLFWLAVLASIVMAVLVIRHIVRKQAARQRAEEARAAELLAVVAANRPASAPAPAPAAAPVPANELGLQKLLFEAAL